ncbi:MAG: amidohydrolase family protein [Spirochaetales bacterium]|nr:amidohydrolase family protein [Spirochaetales bacterium]MCF7936974.1 amidohydrolase family protein [Spirochaetales bacterium]
MAKHKSETERKSRKPDNRDRELLIRGKYLISDPAAGESGILNDAAVYCKEGLVSEVGDYRDLKEKYPGAAVKGNGKQLLMPGLVDSHSHGWGLTLTQQGIPLDFLENGLIDWAFMRGLDPALSSMMSAVRHLRNGCTTRHHNNWGEEPNILENAEKVIEGSLEAGIRLAYSPGGRDMNRLALDDEGFFETLPPELQEFTRSMVFYDKEAFADAYMDLFENLYKSYNGEETRLILGPSWAMGATDKFLQRVKVRADELGGLPIHLHTLQTPVQKAYGLRMYGKSLLAHMDDIGLVDKNLVLGHAVFLTESDIELLAKHGASTTHHPSCNLAVRNGISPVLFLKEAGVNVALGLDDKGINDDEDAIMELRLIHRLHRVGGFDLQNTPALDAFDVLQMGTVNGARVCGFAGEIGALRPGMKADMILVDLEEIMNDPWMAPDLNMAEVFIHRAKGSHVNTAIVGGKVVMEDRRILTVDVQALYEEVRRQAERGISAEQRRFAEALQKIKPYYYQWYEGWDELDYDPFYIMNSRI